MENRAKITYETTALIPASKRRVWGIIKDLSNLSRLTSLSVEGRLEGAGEDAAMGDVLLGGEPFRMRYKPFDLELHGRAAKLGFRLAETREGCKVYAVSVCRTEEAKAWVEALVGTFIRNLSAMAEESRRAEAEAAAKAAEAAARAAEPAPQPEPGYEPAPKKEKPAKKPLSKLSRGLLAAAVLLLCLSVFGVLRIKGRYDSFFLPFMPGEVSAADAAAIQLGMSEGEVASLLGDSGVPADGGVVYGAKGVKVMVRYENGAAAEIRCVLPGASSDADNDKLIDPAADISAVTDIASAEAALGVPASGFVRTAEKNEVCFGFYDPYCSFAKVWMPEYSLFISDSGNALERNWDYSSALPFVVEDLAGTPLAAQYTDMNDLVGDMYGYLSALELLKGYSKGDIERVLGGTLGQYQNFANMVLMELSLREPYATMEGTLPDGTVGEVPAYSISVSLNEGQFRTGVYSNLRLFGKPGMLAGTSHARITRGMGMQEVQQLMGVLPTAFFYDGESLYLCYGRYILTDVLEEQFEFILRINVASDTVTNIYDNIAVAAEQDLANAS